MEKTKKELLKDAEEVCSILEKIEKADYIFVCKFPILDDDFDQSKGINIIDRTMFDIIVKTLTKGYTERIKMIERHIKEIKCGS